MRIFVARLAGTAVFDPSGDQIGRVRDVVIGMPASGPPPVHGMVIEMMPRRRVFLPITRVLSIEPGAVIFSGKINMRRFEQRVTEVLAIAELLDLVVEVNDERGSVLDLAMEEVRPSEWRITKVAVLKERGTSGPAVGTRRRRSGRGIFGLGRRARGETVIVDWGEVRGFEATQRDQGVANLLASYEKLRAADLANALHALPYRRRGQVVAALDDERLADVLEEMPERDRIEILGGLGSERAALVLAAMNPDDATDLLQDLPPERAEALLALMTPQEAAPVRRLLTYGERTAGGMMTTDPVILPPDATIADALAQIRQEEVSPAVAAQVYVTRSPTETPTGTYLGVAHFQRLLRDPPSTLLGAVVDPTIDPIKPELSLAGVTFYLATYNLVAAPVVDEIGRLVGAVTVDDVLDHLLPEDWRGRGGDGVVDAG